MSKKMIPALSFAVIIVVVAVAAVFGWPAVQPLIQSPKPTAALFLKQLDAESNFLALLSRAEPDVVEIAKSGRDHLSVSLAINPNTLKRVESVTFGRARVVITPWLVPSSSDGGDGQRAVGASFDLIYRDGWKVDTDSFAATLNRLIWESRADTVQTLEMYPERSTRDMARANIESASKSVTKLNDILSRNAPSSDGIIPTVELESYGKSIESFDRLDKIDDLIAQAERAYKGGDFEAAIKSFLEARTLDSRYRAAEVAAQLAFSYRDSKVTSNNIEYAVMEAKQAVELRGTSYDELMLGDLYRMSSAYDLSAQAFRRCISLAADSFDQKGESSCRYWYGVLSRQTGDYTGALNQWRKALTLDPTNELAAAVLR